MVSCCSCPIVYLHGKSKILDSVNFIGPGSDDLNWEVNFHKRGYKGSPVRIKFFINHTDETKNAISENNRDFFMPVDQLFLSKRPDLIEMSKNRAVAVKKLVYLPPIEIPVKIPQRHNHLFLLELHQFIKQNNARNS
jgi:hypothetical protein